MKDKAPLRLGASAIDAHRTTEAPGTGVSWARALRKHCSAAAGSVRRLCAPAVAVALLWPGTAAAQFPLSQFQRVQPPANALPVSQSTPALRSSQVSTTPHPAVARITVQERDAISYGSGTLIDVEGQYGLVVSNWHVVRDAAGTITVQFPGGFQSPAQVVKTDADWDLAALSIRRPPNVQPLPISLAAPRPGDLLAIAGYGSGDYRAASGTCTQYLAPGENFPYEMLEISAEARQGDSGGPIFNQRGELAGVLFGAGRGFTSGSYGGRVQMFLASVLPQRSPAAPGTAVAATPPPAATLGPVVPGPAPAPTSLAQAGIGPPISQPQATALHAATPPERDKGFEPLDLAPVDIPLAASTPPAAPEDRPAAGELEGERVATLGDLQADAAARRTVELSPREEPSAGSEGDELARRNFGAIHTTLPPRNPLPAADLNNAPPEQLLAAAWKKLGGSTLFDQAKTVLALVGLLSLLVQFWRLNSGNEQMAEEE